MWARPARRPCRARSRDGQGGGIMGDSPGSSAAAQDPWPRTEPIRTMIVDDHALFRTGLEMVLEGEPDIDLVGQASDGAEAVAKAAAPLPDIVQMGISMPSSSG